MVAGQDRPPPAELDSGAIAYLDRLGALGIRDYAELGVAGARAQHDRIAAAMAPPPCPSAENRSIDTPGGALPVRIYRPAGKGPHPLLVGFHGGGWIMGDLNSYDAQCRLFADEAACVVVSVEYRLAPEHHFPAAVDDAYAATRWAVDQAIALGGDRERVGVFGTSAGANLAAAVALMARDRNSIDLSCQLLIVPALDSAADSRSCRLAEEAAGLSAETMRWFWRQYLGLGGDGMHPYASPLRAGDLSGLPPAIVMTAEFDPLRDDGIGYARALAAAGVRVTHHDYAGMIHTFRGAQAGADAVSALRLLLVRG